MAGTKPNSAGEQQPVDDLQRYAEMSAAELKKRLTIELCNEKNAAKTSSNIGNNTTLTRDEWRRYYDTLGEIQAGMVRARNVRNGRWVILNVNVESNGKRTPARLILDNGNYVSPKVKSVLTFDTDDELYDFIDD